ncbi:MAG: hypothetical protein QXS54_04470 [Candidatus Methanomethylicaceae archaeon]
MRLVRIILFAVALLLLASVAATAQGNCDRAGLVAYMRKEMRGIGLLFGMVYADCAKLISAAKSMYGNDLLSPDKVSEAIALCGDDFETAARVLSCHELEQISRRCLELKASLKRLHGLCHD